ncbi:MAG: hypothetical protein M1833_004879 [Piccolia ochrophora]|nr:MAG: hypothetical protein M1833_004879 [Piccolia ochrophora]
MRNLRPWTFGKPQTPWTCSQCLRKQQRSIARPNASYVTVVRQPPARRPRGKIGWIAATAGTLGAGAYFLSDDVKHIYSAAERTGRVVETLFVCINDYRVTLNHKTDDGDEYTSLLQQCHQRCADRTLRALEKNGSIFIKLGQHLSSMNYLLPLEWTRTFIPLQDKCPVSSFESIEDMFKRDMGTSISDLFSEFERVPIGAASLAQVHRATIKNTGQRVAVKVQHPSLEEWAPLDLALTRFSFSTLKTWFPEYDLEWLSSEMASSLPQELDFSLEGANATRAKEYFSKVNEPALIIPEVIWAQKRILVMDYVTGKRPDDLEYLDANGIDRDEVSAALARIFNEMIFGTNAPLHCDPHGGNIAIRKNTARRKPNFDIILYDHGLYRDIPMTLRRSYAKLWLAVIDADEPAMRKYAYEVAGINDEQFPLFASAITGRDYRVLTKSVAMPRSEQEKDDISDAFGDGLLQQLVQLLGQVPRIILLILKTNDLTRSLDENLHTKQGPMRSFLILARYCARTVFEEQMELVRDPHPGDGRDGKVSTSRARGGLPHLLVSPRALLRLLRAWSSYVRVELKLSLYEWWVSVRGLGLGL